MSSQKQICSICLENEPKYKCPKCYVRYCGLACFKTHKEGSSCSDQAKKIAAEVHQAKHQTSEAVNHYLDSLNDEDILNEDTLMKLWQLPEIQSELKNKEIVDGLLALNSSTKPDADFLKFANIPQYGDFIDKCLESIEHIKSEAEE